MPFNHWPRIGNAVSAMPSTNGITNDKMVNGEISHLRPSGRLYGKPEIECPFCGQVCYADAITKDDIVIYNKHMCRQLWNPIGRERRLEVDKKGNLII